MIGRTVFIALIAVTAESAAQTMVRIEHGSHSGPLTGIAMTASGSTVVTSGRDGTVRVWHMENGKAHQSAVFRLPLEGVAPGAAPSVALARDGSAIAIGFGYRLYVHRRDADCHSNCVVYRDWTAEKRMITSLAFSPDARWLAVAENTGGPMVLTGPLWTRDLSPSGRDACASATDGVAFDHTGTFLAATCRKPVPTVLAYRVGKRTELLSRVPLPAESSGGLPHAVAFDPKGPRNGLRLAVGYNGRPSITVAAVAFGGGTSLETLWPPAGFIKDSDLRSVVWTADGIYAGGRAELQDGRNPIVHWRQPHQRPSLVDAGTDTIFGLAASGTRVAYATGTPSWGLTGRAPINALPSLFRSGDSLEVSDDGDTVCFGDADHRCFRVSSARMVARPAHALRRPETAPIIGYGPSNLDRDRPVGSGEWLRCRDTFGPTARRRVLYGTERRLVLSDGIRSIREAPLDSTAWTCVVTADKRLAVVGHGDRRVTWYRLSDLEPLLNLFLHPDGRWVLWKPDGGTYSASAGGESLIGFHTEADPRQMALLMPPWRFDESLRNPDEMRRALALRHASIPTPRVEPVPTAATTQRLEVAVFDRERSTFDSTSVKFRLRIRPRANVSVSHQLDGFRSRGNGFKEVRGADVIEYNAILPRQDVTIRFVARNRLGHIGYSQPLRMRWNGRDEARQNARVLAIASTGHLPGMSELLHPEQDAQNIAAQFKSEQGRAFNRVDATVLRPSNSTRRAILDALDDLVRHSDATTLSVVALAGHGVLKRSADGHTRYFFLAHDADAHRIDETTVSAEELVARIGALRGPALTFIDTCHAAGAIEYGAYHRLINDLLETDTVVFTAAGAAEQALESTRGGLFTQSVLAGLRCESYVPSAQHITLSMLERFVRGDFATKGWAQSPRVFPDPLGELDFELVRCR